MERKEKNKITKKEILENRESGETIKIKKIKDSQKRKEKKYQRLTEADLF